jgi:hypothetical protein
MTMVGTLPVRFSGRVPAAQLNAVLGHEFDVLAHGHISSHIRLRCDRGVHVEGPRAALKHVRELTYLRASAEAYFLLGVEGWKFDQATCRLTPVLLDGSDGPIAELREMHERFSAQRRLIA